MFRIKLFPLFCISLILFIWASSCVHEPIFPSDGGNGPVDTIGNPVDTTTQTIHLCDPDTVYFERDVLPLLISNCAKSGCHDQASAQDGVILANYASVMSTGEVIPSNPGESDLYKAITETDLEDIMPPLPNTQLSQDQIALVSRWISQGAKNLTCSDSVGSGCDTTNVTYSAMVAPLMSKYCTGCHSGTSASGGISLNSYSGVSAVATNGKLYGTISHQQGFVAMPKGGNKLSECDIVKVKTWIDSGANNN
ncbi:MAG: c-type cytochrome domain-containing protein [Bacteroidia bacterium]|nr:c-type cytochrome domain-containing protein [Bacteroidia bacterium]